MIKYFFRIDDVAPNMNWGNFNRVVGIFKRHNIKPLLAVIPDNQDPELLKYSFGFHFWQIIYQLRRDGWIIAQHGYQHVRRGDGGILKIHKWGEFGGVDFENQKSMINSGKAIISQNNLATDIFVAPRHSFDYNTVEALGQAGFQYISDGIALYPFKKRGIVWLPQITWRPRSFPFGLLTFALHHNTMGEKDFSELQNFIKNNREKIGRFDELVLWYGNASSPKRFIVYAANLIFKPLWLAAYRIKHGLSR